VPTQEKTESVAALRERLGTAKTAVLTEYRGLTVRQLADLRKQLKAAAAEYKVVKNRLARLAVKDLDLGPLGSHFKGPTGLVFTTKDPVPVAKALQNFVKANPLLTIKVGFGPARGVEGAGRPAVEGSAAEPAGGGPAGAGFAAGVAPDRSPAGAGPGSRGAEPERRSVV